MGSSAGVDEEDAEMLEVGEVEVELMAKLA